MSSITQRFFFSALLLLAAAPASAGEGVPELNLAVAGESVGVFGPGGRLIQTLPIGGQEPDERNREYFAAVEDMDFDGFPDVRILFSQGAANTYYDCWLWRRDEGGFAINEAMRELSNPVFDPAARTVSVFERGSAVHHVKGDLVWDGGELVWLAKKEMDAADDGKDVVIRRYLRDADGELRLIAQKTYLRRELLDSDYDEMDDAQRLPDPPGPNLFLNFPADTLAAASLPNGEWWVRLAAPDRSLLWEARRLPAPEYGAAAVERLIRLEWPSAEDAAIAPFPRLTEKTGFPALKAEFLDGGNEDARQFVAALVFAGDQAFWFVLEAPVDGRIGPEEADGPVDADADNARLKRDMEDLLLEMEAVDPARDGFPAASAAPVHLAGTDSTMRLGVMDALVRIQKIVRPGDSPWNGDGAAYRYDGQRTLAGRPALFFSFGTGDRESFAARRHFAVDETGTIHETDDPSGGDCWTWEERTPLWWGEYRRGGTALRIHNYREGPYGMYFIFAFAEGGEELFTGTAPVRGREASYGPFAFSLAEDGASVEVGIDPERPRPPEWEGFARLAGVYGIE